MRMRIVPASTWLALLLATPLAAQQPAAQPASPSKLTLDSYFDLDDAQAPQLSPDGKQISYTRRWVDKLSARWESSLWSMNADGSRSRQLVTGSNAVWSPGGTRI